jgi:lipoprotein-anchoring transpeptidase ErfK/SrfK
MILKIFLYIVAIFFSLQTLAYDFEATVQNDYDCSGIIYNDEMAEFCKASGQKVNDNILWDAGARNVFHSFQKITKSLTPEIEADYSLIMLVNSAEVKSNSSTDFIPGQSMMLVEKPRNSTKMFKRDSQGVITGLAGGVRQLSQIIGTSHRKKISQSSSNNYGMPYERNGIEVVPVSTGSANHLLSFSGIFQVNWPRSKALPRKSWGNPMSNPLYLGYYYSNSKGQRERISYAAAHGTPQGNWKFLGKARDSHGCTRVHPAVMEDIRAYVEDMAFENVFEFDWDFELPVQEVKVPYAPRKPMLIMIFNGFAGVSV